MVESSSVLIEDKGRYLLNVYDSSYPFEHVRNHFHFFGGSFEKETPHYAMKREIEEELPDYARKIIPELRYQKRYQIEGLHVPSTVYMFRAEIPLDSIDLKIARGEKVTTEGEAIVAKKSLLERGIIRGAWGHSSIINDLIGAKIPEYEGIKCST